MFYIYIIQSLSSGNYYIGYSNDPFRRVEEHNTTPFNTYTSKHRPWQLRAVFECGNPEGQAIKVEKFIKRQKSRSFVERLCDANFLPDGKLAQLVRVPHVRD